MTYKANKIFDMMHSMQYYYASVVQSISCLQYCVHKKDSYSKMSWVRVSYSEQTLANGSKSMSLKLKLIVGIDTK